MLPGTEVVHLTSKNAKPTYCAGSVTSPAGGRPTSAPSVRSAALGVPRPGSGRPNAPHLGSGQPNVPGLKLPLPAEITHQAWAVDDCQYKGLPLRPQPVLRIRLPCRARMLSLDHELHSWLRQHAQSTACFYT